MHLCLLYTMCIISPLGPRGAPNLYDHSYASQPPPPLKHQASGIRMVDVFYFRPGGPHICISRSVGRGEAVPFHRRVYHPVRFLRGPERPKVNSPDRCDMGERPGTGQSLFHLLQVQEEPRDEDRGETGVRVTALGCK